MMLSIILPRHIYLWGVGSSGLGVIMGKKVSDFSHYKSILAQSTAFDMKIRYSSTKVL